ncbi:aminoglycoside phosphotransferase family protein [Sneathiella glossodoripedis]|uniref:aminoglycoside phosphotransferase family protein n=1 Tax=Sneathiella glossodoripedis TaxID=418853 RepID=UPI000472E6A4|nr:phosphotransferase [Sneathiella glossodoripedis]
MTDLHFSLLKGTPWSGAAPVSMAGDASSRSYYRLAGGEKPAVLMIDPDPDTVEKFLKIAKLLKKREFSAPEIYHVDVESGVVILEDLGDGLLASLIDKDPNCEKDLYQLAVDFLIRQKGLEKPIGLPFFSQSYVLDQNAAFLDFYVPEILGAPLADNARYFFHQIWVELLKQIDVEQEVFLHRDFHAQNLLYLPDRSGLHRLGLLDFQDAMTGPAAYDLASLLQDVRRQVDPDIAQKMIEYYISETNVDEKAFKRDFAILGAHRCLRILGVFTRLSKLEGKNQYIALLPRVIGHLNDNLAHPDLLALKHWIKVTLGTHQAEVRL